VPPIDSAPSLRIEYRRAYITAFWMVLATTLFAGSSLVAIASGMQAPWRVSAAVVAAFVLPGVVWRPWFEKGIWVWNGGTYFLAAALSSYILRVCYLLLLTPLGASSSALDLRASAAHRSRWIERPAARDDRTSRGDELSRREELHDGLNAFARTPGNAWAIALFPVLLLTWLRHTSQETAPPGSTYTLY
jgi:hypothetical protein